jgi:hypothetical protein
MKRQFAALLNHIGKKRSIVLASVFSFCSICLAQQYSVKYEYPLYPWVRNWSQTFVYEWQNYQSVDKILSDIRMIDNVTRGIPKVVVIPGLQKVETTKCAPWDNHWPSFHPLRDGLSRPEKCLHKSCRYV